MPRAAADSVIVITSSSSSEEGGEGRGGSTSSARYSHHSTAAAAATATAAAVGGKNGDGVRKKKERKEREKETGAVPSGEARRAGEESGQEKKPKAKAPKKKKNKEEEKEKKAPFASVYAGDSVASGGEFAPPSIIFALPGSPVKRPPVGGKGGGGRSIDRARKEKRKEWEEGTSAVGGGEVRREGEETKANAKRKTEEKKKKATLPSLCAGDVVTNGTEVGRPCPTGGSAMDPAMRLVAESAGRSVNSVGKNTDGVRKKKSEDGEVETSAVANGKVRREGEERKTKVKKKDKNGEETEKKAASPSSYFGDVVATSDEVGRPSPTCSFPMRRVKRLIAGSEDRGSKGIVRTSLDAVFLVNKASELFLELFAQDAYAHATQEHKKALFYKHLSSTVCDGKRYEFLSDFVPEKVRAEDALKALTEQP